MLSLIHWNPFLHLCQKLVEYICVALSLSSLLQSINLCVYPTISTMVSRLQFNSVQSLSCVQLFVTSWTAAHQASLSVTNSQTRACSNSCPSSWWCHPTILSSVILFSFCHHLFPASEFFPVSQFFTSGGQSIGVSASASVPSNEYSVLISFRMD